jgi:hypothetical protein
LVFFPKRRNVGQSGHTDDLERTDVAGGAKETSNFRSAVLDLERLAVAVQLVVRLQPILSISFSRKRFRTLVFKSLNENNI